LKSLNACIEFTAAQLWQHKSRKKFYMIKSLETEEVAQDSEGSNWQSNCFHIL